MTTRYEKNKRNFESWLISTHNYSKKVAKDHVSRCKRIEKNITSDLSKSVFDENNFVILMKAIQEYSVSSTSTKESAYTLSGTLRAAAKKYALYLYPEKAKNYPAAHGKSHYS